MGIRRAPSLVAGSLESLATAHDRSSGRLRDSLTP